MPAVFITVSAHLTPDSSQKGDGGLFMLCQVVYSHSIPRKWHLIYLPPHLGGSSMADGPWLRPCQRKRDTIALHISPVPVTAASDSTLPLFRLRLAYIPLARPIMVPSLLLGIAIPFAVGQRTGTMVKEANPNLLWSNCTAANSCQTVNSSLVLDANLRWIHEADGWRNCFTDAVWDPKLCPNDVSCTANCVMEGVDNYSTAYGIRTKNDSVSLQLVTRIEFSKNVGSRVFLLDETKTKYQTFVLQGNEFAFDVDLATVECGINSAMYFLSMDADGGVERFKPLNQAGAGYGTGYCDAQCPMDGKFIGGKVGF